MFCQKQAIVLVTVLKSVKNCYFSNDAISLPDLRRCSFLDVKSNSASGHTEFDIA